MKQNEVILLLDQAKYLFLREISEPEDNSLRLVVEEAIVDRSTVRSESPSALFAGLLKDASPVRSTDNCKIFELRWTRYVAYLVTEEMAGSVDRYEDETYTGNLFRAYTRSHFLDYLSRNLGGHAETLVHHKVLCQNHLIDVASYDNPVVRLLPRS